MEVFGLRKCFCGSREVDYMIYGFEAYVFCKSCQKSSPVLKAWPGESTSERRERARRGWNEYIESHFSTCRALVVTSHIVVHETANDKRTSDEPSVDQHETESKLEDVIERKLKAQTALNKIVKRLSDFSSTLNKHNADLVEEFRRCEREIAELTAAIHESNTETNQPRDPDDLDKEFEFDDKFEEFRSADDAYEEPESFEERVLISEKVKKLFRKIANKTHPDKTDDPEYHQLFRSAKQYQKENDYDGLLEIWNYISGTVSRILSKILKRLQQEIEELRNTERQLAAVRESNDYKLLTLYEQNREAVLQQTRLQLRLKIDQMQNHLRMLNVIAGREDKPNDPPNVFFNFG